MLIHVKMFAILRDRSGAAGIDLDLPPGATVADAAEKLAQRFPVLREHAKSVAYAVNRTYSPSSTTLEDGDELALIPPVSGG